MDKKMENEMETGIISCCGCYSSYTTPKYPVLWNSRYPGTQRSCKIACVKSFCKKVSA